MKSSTPIIAVDIMGGDDEPLSRLRAVIKFKASHPQFAIKLFVNDAHLKQKQSIYDDMPDDTVLV